MLGKGFVRVYALVLPTIVKYLDFHSFVMQVGHNRHVLAKITSRSHFFQHPLYILGLSDHYTTTSA